MTSDTAAPVIYHYSGGRWTHTPAPLKTNVQTDLELIPGTQSVLATSEPGGSGAVVKYGP
jgi:hypothetical protein